MIFVSNFIIFYHKVSNQYTSLIALHSSLYYNLLASTVSFVYLISLCVTSVICYSIGKCYNYKTLENTYAN